MSKYKKNLENRKSEYIEALRDDDQNIKEYAIVAILLAIIHFLMEFMYLYFACTPMVVINVFSFLTYILSVYLLNKGYSLITIWLMEGEVFVHTILACSFLGTHCGFQMWLFGIFSSVYLPFFIPRLSKMPRKQIGVFVFFVVVTFETLTYLGNHDLLPTTYRVDDEIATVMYYVNASIGFGAILLYAAIFNRIMTVRNKELQKIADRDGLTGIFNRQKIQQLLDEEIAKELDEGEKNLAVAILDIDYFKNINDSYGHLAGDEVLKELARIFGDTKFKNIKYGRWGGEEFFLISPHDISYDEFGRMLEGIRTEVQDCSINCSGQDIRITVSIGAAKYESGMSGMSLIKAADERLYKAKEMGRNCIVYK